MSVRQTVLGALGRRQAPAVSFDRVARRLEGIKYTTPESGRVLYDWIIERKIESILEVGFHHGVSTCYMGTALAKLGYGHITTLDLRGSRDKDPSLPELLDEFGLSQYVTPVFAERSYTWELYKLLNAEPRPAFDFVFHDADHTWDTTALAFFLMDKMLVPGGWMLFDDYPWTIEASDSVKQTTRGKFPEEERRTPAVAEVFRLLISERPDYGNFTLTKNGKWAWIQKLH